MTPESDTLDAAVAGDEHANDEYAAPTSATSAAPVPPEVFPDVLAEQQSAEQGGDDERSDGGTPAPELKPLASMDAGELQAEVDERELDVKGTGANGNVTAEDNRKALAEARAAE